MNTSTKQYVMTIGTYINIYQVTANGGYSRRPVCFYELPTNATTPEQAVSSICRAHFGEGAGSFKKRGDSTELPRASFAQLGITRETAPRGEVSVVVPYYTVTIDPTKCNGKYTRP